MDPLRLDAPLRRTNGAPPLTSGSTFCKLTSVDTQITLGQHIRELRDKCDLSIRELAKKVGLSPAFLSDVELGRRNPSPENLTKIAHVLRVPAKELLHLDTRPDSESLRRMATLNPAYGFAFRQIVQQNISPKELMDLLDKNRDQRRNK